MIQVRHADLEAFAFLSNQVFRRRRDVFKSQLAGGGGVRAHFLQRAARDARPRPCQGLEETLMGLQHREATLVPAVDLMQSVLHPAGAEYQIRHSERLS